MNVCEWIITINNKNNIIGQWLWGQKSVSAHIWRKYIDFGFVCFFSSEYTQIFLRSQSLSNNGSLSAKFISNILMKKAINRNGKDSWTFKYVFIHFGLNMNFVSLSTLNLNLKNKMFFHFESITVKTMMLSRSVLDRVAAVSVRSIVAVLGWRKVWIRIIRSLRRRRRSQVCMMPIDRIKSRQLGDL